MKNHFTRRNKSHFQESQRHSNNYSSRHQDDFPQSQNSKNWNNKNQHRNRNFENSNSYNSQASNNFRQEKGNKHSPHKRFQDSQKAEDSYDHKSRSQFTKNAEKSRRNDKNLKEKESDQPKQNVYNNNNQNKTTNSKTPENSQNHKKNPEAKEHENQKIKSRIAKFGLNLEPNSQAGGIGERLFQTERENMISKDLHSSQTSPKSLPETISTMEEEKTPTRELGSPITPSKTQKLMLRNENSGFVTLLNKRSFLDFEDGNKTFENDVVEIKKCQEGEKKVKVSDSLYTRSSPVEDVTSLNQASSEDRCSKKINKLNTKNILRIQQLYKDLQSQISSIEERLQPDMKKSIEEKQRQIQALPLKQRYLKVINFFQGISINKQSKAE